MPVTDKEHFDALRAADQRAIELLAKANADRVKTGHLIASNLIAILAVLVAVAAVIFHR